MYGFILSKKGENSFAQNFKVLALSTDFLKQKRTLHINTTSFFSGNGNKELAFDSACNLSLIHIYFFLYYMLRFHFAPAKIYRMAKMAFAGNYENEVILKWMKKFYWRFFSQQFKRSCLPDGPKVGSVAVSPRGDLQMCIRDRRPPACELPERSNCWKKSPECVQYKKERSR